MTTKTQRTATRTRLWERHVVVVLLAGGVRPPALRQQLGRPVLCLPIDEQTALLHRWMAALDHIPGCEAVRIAVSTQEDADAIAELLSRDNKPARQSKVQPEVLVEPANWRGPAGLMYDVAHDLLPPSGGIVLAAEAARLPPADLDVVIEQLDSSAPGLSASTRSGEPVGLYAFDREAISLVPPVGFYDIKEQLLPSLYARGTPVSAVQIADEVQCIRDRVSYLRTVQAVLRERGATISCAASATVSETAHVAGCCLIAEGAVIGQGAVVHDSVVLDGARIEEGAVVSQSIVAPGVRVQPRAVVRGRVLGANGPGAARHAGPARRMSQLLGIRGLLNGEARA